LSEVNHMDHLMRCVDEFPNHKKLIVFIDGLYNLEVAAGKNEGIRVQNIEKANKIKLITDKYRIPLIATGELRKKLKTESKRSKPTMHDLMETGKFAYNANVIWLLYLNDPDTINEPYQILELEYAKNKLSDFKGIQNLDFTRSTGTIKEINFATGPTGNLFDDLGGEIE
jgi:replicative DNA helicase